MTQSTTRPYHLVSSLKARERHFIDGVLFMSGLLRGQKGCICCQWEMDTREAVVISRICSDMGNAMVLTGPSWFGTR
jgi:hypothetical protein